LLPLRLIIGFGFMAHGYVKLSKGVDGFADILQTIGVPAAVLAAWTTRHYSMSKAWRENQSSLRLFSCTPQFFSELLQTQQFDEAFFNR